MTEFVPVGGDEEWADGGATAVINGDAKCERDHYRKDARGWLYIHDPASATARGWYVDSTESDVMPVRVEDKCHEVTSTPRTTTSRVAPASTASGSAMRSSAKQG